jgi:site-specific DNA-cytosine methylase
MTVRAISMFSGTGMLDVGVHKALGHFGLKVKTVMYCECEPYATDIIRARIRDGLLDDAPIHPDVRTLPAQAFRGKVSLCVGGFPCQDLSHAGKKAGIGKGTRSGLFFDLLRVAKDSDSELIFLENVPAILTTQSVSVLDDGRVGWEPAVSLVVRALHEAGFNAMWMVHAASDVGAPHGRERWWCLAAKRDGKRAKGEGHVCDLLLEDAINTELDALGGHVARLRVTDEILERYRAAAAESPVVARYAGGMWEPGERAFEGMERDPMFWILANGPEAPSSDAQGQDRWPRQGMAIDGVIHPLSDLRLGVNNSERVNRDWPTPVSYDSTPGGPNNHYKGLGHLAVHGGIYSAPAEGSGDAKVPVAGAGSLDQEWSDWWTGPAGDGSDRRRMGAPTQQRGLPEAVRFYIALPWAEGRVDAECNPEGAGNWATPTARDHRSGREGEKTIDRKAMSSKPLPDQVDIITKTGLLNPAWTELMMGWPMGWTATAGARPGAWLGFPMGMGPKQHPWEPPRVVAKGEVRDRAARIKACGNGVVPQCATVAYLFLTGWVADRRARIPVGEAVAGA